MKIPCFSQLDSWQPSGYIEAARIQVPKSHMALTILIIRPAADNRSMEIRLQHVRTAVRDIVDKWVDLK